MSDEEGSDGGNDEAIKDVEEVEGGGGLRYQATTTRINQAVAPKERDLDRRRRVGGK